MDRIMISGYPHPKSDKIKISKDQDNYENRFRIAQQNYANSFRQYISIGDFYKKDKYNVFNKNLFKHRCSTEQGMSGSAVFVQTKKNFLYKTYQIIGIHLNAISKPVTTQEDKSISKQITTQDKSISEQITKQNKVISEKNTKKDIFNLGNGFGSYEEIKKILNKQQILLIGEKEIQNLLQNNGNSQIHREIYIPKELSSQKMQIENENEQLPRIQNRQNSIMQYNRIISKLQKVSDLKAIKQPYCSIVLLQLRNGLANDPGYATGTLIKLQNEYYILTVAHNIYDRKNRCYYEINAYYYYYSEFELLEPTLRDNINYLKLDIYDNEYRIKGQYKNQKIDCITYFDIGLIKCKSLDRWPNIRVMEIFYDWQIKDFQKFKQKQKSKILVSGYSLDQKKNPNELVAQYMNQQ